MNSHDVLSRSIAAFLTSDVLDSLFDGLKMTPVDRARCKLGAVHRNINGRWPKDMTVIRAVFSGDDDALRAIRDNEEEHPAARDGARRILG